MEPQHHELRVHWSSDDELFVVEVPELPGCSAHGKTPADAATNAQDAIALWIDMAREHGRLVPEPKVRRDTIA